jgi:hypothetical protein
MREMSGSLDLAPILVAHSYLTVERPPTLWALDADDER